METKNIYEKPFITADYLRGLGEEERKVTVIDEGILRDFEGKQRLTVKVQFASSKDIKDLKISPQTWENIRKEYGTETSNWLSKQLLLTIKVYGNKMEGVIAEPINIKSSDNNI